MNDMTVPVLELRHLTTSFHTRQGWVPVVNDVSFSLLPGRVLGLVGESGSGKSVTGFSIMGLISPPGHIEQGEILFRGEPLQSLSESAWRARRGRDIAMIFQDPMSTLNPVLTIEVQMTEAIRAHRPAGRAQARAQAIDALASVGIASPEQRLKAFPHQLSGGMRQRVAIAIALLHDPALIIADEPTTALDVTIQAQILSLIQQRVAERGTSLIWISHDLSVVAGLADDIAVMYAGRVVEYGSVDQVLDSPRHPYTRGLIDSLPASVPHGQPLRQIPGMTPALADLPPGCAFAPRCGQRTDACKQEPPLQTLSGQRVRCVHPLAGASLTGVTA